MNPRNVPLTNIMNSLLINVDMASLKTVLSKTELHFLHGKLVETVTHNLQSSAVQWDLNPFILICKLVD